MQRHSNLGGFQMPDAKDAVFMRARCKYISVLDFSLGLGHREQLVIDDTGTPVDAAMVKEEWGSATAS